jgi:5-methylcytosine-specific restriction endonuclease McrA
MNDQQTAGFLNSELEIKQLTEHSVEHPQVKAAVIASLKRVRPDLTGVEFDIELAWQLRSVVFTQDKKPAIVWARLGIGRDLKRCLLEAQNHRCCYCGRRMEERSVNRDEVATFEHVVPLGRGGPDHPANLVIACHGCNGDRGVRFYSELHGRDATGTTVPQVLSPSSPVSGPPGPACGS